MEVKILSEQENKLFNRKKVRFEVVHDNKTTPDLVKVRRELAAKTGSNASHVIIDGFKTLFGIGRTMGDARIYKNMEELKDYEPKYLLVRNKIVKEEEPAPKKEEEKKEPAKEGEKNEPAKKSEKKGDE